MNKRFQWAVGGGLIVGILLLTPGAGTIEQSGVFQSLKLGGRTNLISDNGTALTRDGVPLIPSSGGSGTNLTLVNPAADTLKLGGSTNLWSSSSGTNLTVDGATYPSFVQTTNTLGVTTTGLAVMQAADKAAGRAAIDAQFVNGIINVKQPPYSAKGDGITDDTAAIQAAITACPYAGVVEFPAGTYLFQTLTAIHPITLIGHGWRINTSGYLGNANYANTALRDGSILSCITNSGPAISFSGASSWGYNLKDLLVIGSGSGSVTGVVMQVPALANAIINSTWSHVTIANFNVGTYLGFCINNKFKDITYLGCSTGLVAASSSHANDFIEFNFDFFDTAAIFADSSGNNILKPLVQNCRDNSFGIVFQETTPGTIYTENVDQGWFEHGGTNVAGLLISAGRNITVQNSLFGSTDTLVVSNGFNHVIKNNYMLNTQTNVFLAAGVSNITLICNDIKGVVSNGATNTTVQTPQGALTQGSQMGFQGYDTASLPTGLANGFQTYCTDCLTVVGTGDRVEWLNGSWTTLRNRVKATTDLNTFILSCASNGVAQTTPITDCSVLSALGPTYANSWGRANQTVGTSASVGIVSVGTAGVVIQYTSGTTTNGYAAGWAQYLNAAQSGDSYAMGGMYSVSAAGDGTDNYAAIIGLTSANASNYITSGVFFLYDKYDQFGHGQAYTNNWICVSAKASSYTYTDSGLAVRVSGGASAFDRLGIVMSTTGATFLTNGVACSTHNSTTIPAVALYANHASVLKSAGTTARALYETNPWYHIRRGTARSF